MKMKRICTAILSAALLLALAACGSTPPDNSGSEEPGGSQPQNQTQEPVETPPETPEVTTYAVGDEAELNDWGISLTEFEFTDRIDGDYNIYVSPDEGCKLAVAHLSVTNNATEAASFLPTFSMNDDVRARIMSGEYEFQATNLLAITEDLHDETLNPLVTVSGIIAFNIPDSIVDGTEPLVLVLEESSETLEFTLR